MSAADGSGDVALVRRYLGCVATHDWDGAADCLTPDVVRVGPFGDTFTPREPYLAHLAELMPSLPGYAMEIHRVVAQGGVAGRVVTAELTETVEVDGRPLRTPEALVFDLGGDGRITRIAIYLQRRPDDG